MRSAQNWSESQRKKHTERNYRQMKELLRKESE